MRHVYAECTHVLFRAGHYSDRLASMRGILRTLSRLMTLAARLCEHAAPAEIFVDLPKEEMDNFLAEVCVCVCARPQSKLGEPRD